jgi:hypothetical protein
MSDDLKAAADALDPAGLQTPLAKAMTRIVVAAEGNVRRVTRVRSGTLRRSWTHLVEATGKRGIVGTNVAYAPFQRNDPLGEGWDQTKTELPAILGEAGAAFLGKVRGRQG